MSNAMYSYKGGVQALSREKAESIVLELERSLRGGTVTYRPKPEISKSQLAEIKAKWAGDVIGAFRASVKAISDKAGETKVSPATGYLAVVETAVSCLAPMRKAMSAVSVDPLPAIMADLALSMALDAVPDVSGAAGVRTIKDQRVMVRTTEGVGNLPPRLVVYSDAVCDADIHVLALRNDHTESVTLLGWAMAEDLRAASCGSRDTDPTRCPWSKPACWIEIDKLRPMAELMQKFGIATANEGVVFEKPPALADLPVRNTRLDGYLPTGSQKIQQQESMFSMPWMQNIRLPEAKPAAEATASQHAEAKQEAVGTAASGDEAPEAKKEASFQPLHKDDKFDF